jgi:CRP-like cAMP-binding protein
MLAPLIKKLERRFTISKADRAALESLNAYVASVRARNVFILEGDAPDHAHLIHSGFACRYKALADGTRLILGFLIPGDFCDLNAHLLGSVDYSVRTLSDCEIVQIPREALSNTLSSYPILDQGFRWMSLLDESILREWLISAKCRSAEKQVGHLFCEFLLRLQAVGLSEENSYDLPLTQADIGDATGLSTVHVNRMLQRLRSEKLLEFRDKRANILNVKALTAFAEFNPRYLHLGSELKGT